MRLLGVFDHLFRHLSLISSCSALDTSTERDIQKALQNLVQGRSSLSIAHRLSVRCHVDTLHLILVDVVFLTDNRFRRCVSQVVSTHSSTI